MLDDIEKAANIAFLIISSVWLLKKINESDK